MHDFKLEPLLRRNLLVLATAYAKHAGIKFSTVSRPIAGDRLFLDKLKARKCGFTIRTYDRAMKWFDAKWPADLTKPQIWQPPKR